MGNRLSKIVTRTGDAGTTGLATGDRVAKTDPRVAAMGDLDELNSTLGVLLAHELPGEFRDALSVVQHRLFDIGGELAMPGHTAITDEHVAQLETWAEAFNAELPPLKDFVLPGGGAAAAQAHLTRAITRRAERALWGVHTETPLNLAALRYVNRLSDLMFIIGRRLARADGGNEVIWRHA
ncbi:cob(I)yrinic acid a,c-diamide adenosyltransferase [Solimonas marina]|uniref:Corrinoid adenosyltransferase n=1 Tax=Solimonas marina TaxID=2714601 RepID=A0A969W6Z7_9GAMM|nr:cob(I)yrinic acid a,c-diamide adenosyltransferase [Solimonas marina]NKF20689.1 cob(I)yrinic acid a,c-diamide adenosyltransferase [Solimonas marina]